MVEEAAGTRMFEDRKEKAKKTMAKKEMRVQEIKSLLDEEITPKLNKLRAGETGEFEEDSQKNARRREKKSQLCRRGGMQR
jgi:chromosome segregation ATPase